jgi:hypothetical protein
VGDIEPDTQVRCGGELAYPSKCVLSKSIDLADKGALGVLFCLMPDNFILPGDDRALMHLNLPLSMLPLLIFKHVCTRL